MSPAEELHTAVVEGRPVKRGTGEPPTKGDSWGEDRELCADVLYRLLARPASALKPRAAVLVGLRITGRLNLEASELQAPLIAHGCYFEYPVNLIAAKAPEIRLTTCHLPGIDAEKFDVRGDLDLSGSTLAIVNLIGAHIGGDLGLTGATLTGGQYPLDLGDGTLRPPESAPQSRRKRALRGDGLRVDQAMFCDEGEGGQRFTANGEVRLLAAHIGSLSFSGAHLTNRDGEALIADVLRVDQSMICDVGEGGQRFIADGGVRLVGAHIGSQLRFDGAHLTNTSGPALNAARLRADQDMVCEVERGQRFTAQGEVRLVGAHIGGYLRLNGAHLTNPSREALSADRLRVDQDMVCGACKDGQRFTAQGEVRLVGAHIGGQLSFNGAELSGSPTALTLSEAQVASSLWLRLHGEDPPKGAVDLRRARAGAIHDRAYCRPQTWPMTFLEDCRYESLESDPAVDVKTRLNGYERTPAAIRPSPTSSSTRSSDSPET
jgi:hypothetical protein